MVIALKDGFLKIYHQSVDPLNSQRFHLKRHILPSREVRSGSKACFPELRYFHLEETRTSGMETKLYQCNLGQVILENY